ncbi:MAG TPA: HAD family hydrolase [Candidatus Brocadiia bacterium]|nr:HAD family hydrolase [Candidatus Brocadiia bacterium]
MGTFIFFDIDATLFDTRGAMTRAVELFAAERRGELAGPVEALCEAWVEAAHIHFERYLAGEIPHHESRVAAMRDLFGRQGRRLNQAEAEAAAIQYARLYEASFRLMPDARACLDALADVGMGVISNGDGPTQRSKLARTGALSRFDPVIISGEVGVVKPAPEIFLMACRAAKRRPAQCVYVGDRLDTDARAAAAAGMRGVWLDRKGGGAAEDVEVIRSLAELPALVLGSASTVGETA